VPPLQGDGMLPPISKGSELVGESEVVWVQMKPPAIKSSNQFNEN